MPAPMPAPMPAARVVDPLSVPLSSEVHCPWDERWSGTLTYRPGDTVTLVDKHHSVLFRAPLADLAPASKVDTIMAFSIEGKEIPFSFGDPKAYARALRWDFSGYQSYAGFTHHRAKNAWNATSGMNDWAALFTAAGILTVNELPRDPWRSIGKPLAIALAAIVILPVLGALIVGFGMKLITN